MPRVSSVSGQLIETTSALRNSSFDLAGAALARLLGVDIRVVGKDFHAEQAAAEFGNAPPDIADADNAGGLAIRLAAGEGGAVSQRAGAQRAITFDHPLGERQQHAEHVFSDRFGVAAGLVDDQDAALGAGLHIDGVVTGAVGRYDQQVRRVVQKLGAGVVVPRELVAGRAGLIGVRGR